MQAKNIVAALMLVLAGAVVIVFALGSNSTNNPLKDTAGKALFNSESVHLTLECSHDFLGITNHGEDFEFHKYSVSSSERIKVVVGTSFPVFQDGLYGKPPKDLQSIKSSSWQPTPVRSEDRMYTSATEFVNLQDYSCSKQFVADNYINKPGNFYAFFSAYPVGNFVYVWAPAEQKLFLIKKRG